MRAVVILLFCALIISLPVASQSKRKKNKWQKGETGCIPVKNYTIKKTAGIGVRLGEPYGITYKNYFSKLVAFEVVGGGSSGGLNANYIRREFLEFEGYEDNDYVAHDIDYIIAFQVRMMFQKNLTQYVDGLEWYAGLGAQFRYLAVTYTFRQPDPNGPTPDSFDLLQEQQKFQSWGPETFVGFEYPLVKNKLVTFAEATLFLDDFNNLENLRFMGGLGIRYHFR